MTMISLIKKLNKQKHSVFSTEEIALLAEETNIKTLNNRIGHYLKTGELILLRRGVYTLTRDYDPLELACRINRPSYISFQTVLIKEGCVFQFYPQIFLASYLSREVKIDNNIFVFKILKKSILTNTSGIQLETRFSIANKERAFLDMIYLYPGYYFDNLRSIDWGYCFELVKIYSNKSMIKRLEKYYKENKNA